MIETRGEVGHRGETLALDYLVGLGYRLRQRNFRFRRGEIDLILESPEGDLVFVEVKSCRGDMAGDPLTWVTGRKQKQLQRVAQGFCLLFGESHRPMRFDVVGVDLDANASGSAQLRHIPHAFLPDTSGYYH
jgi:putative endonuclease